MHIVIKRCNVHVKSAQTVVFLAKNRDKKDEMQKFESIVKELDDIIGAIITLKCAKTDVKK